MVAYTTTVNNILKSLGVQPEASPCAQVVTEFDRFKQFAITDAMDNNDLNQDSPAIRQLTVSTDIEHLETLLRQNLDYCDECMIKLYRRYITNGLH